MSVSWYGRLTSLFQEFRQVPHPSHDCYLQYCFDRNAVFRALFARGDLQVPGSDLRFCWLRHEHGRVRGVAAVYLLPPLLYAGVSFCSPREPFNRESGFYKATRLAGECPRLECRHADMIGSIKHPCGLQFQPRIGADVVEQLLAQGGKKSVVLARGVEWLVPQNRRFPSWVSLSGDYRFRDYRDEPLPVGHEHKPDDRLRLAPVFERMLTAVVRRFERQRELQPVGA